MSIFFNNLPTEMQFQVFKNLSFDDLKTLRQVNKSLNILSTDFILKTANSEMTQFLENDLPMRLITDQKDIVNISAINLERLRTTSDSEDMLNCQILTNVISAVINKTLSVADLT